VVYLNPTVKHLPFQSILQGVRLKRVLTKPSPLVKLTRIPAVSLAMLWGYADNNLVILQTTETYRVMSLLKSFASKTKALPVKASLPFSLVNTCGLMGVAR
jgi:hypothetical protein